MKTRLEKGCYGEGTVYVLETIEDFDKYEELLKSQNKDFLKYNPNFYEFKEDFKKYIGKIWEDKDNLRYCLDGIPIYPQYKIIAIEDDNAMCDWYWVVQNIDDQRDVKYLLCNDPDFESCILNK